MIFLPAKRKSTTITDLHLELCLHILNVMLGENYEFILRAYLLLHRFERLCQNTQFERELIRERTNAGLKAARGRVGGRPTKMNPEKIRMAKLLHQDVNNKLVDILKALDVKKDVFYKMLKV